MNQSKINKILFSCLAVFIIIQFATLIYLGFKIIDEQNGKGFMAGPSGRSSPMASPGIPRPFTQGGGILATSTINAAETLLASDFDTENRIEYTMNVQATTLTLPASSTLVNFIPAAGDSRMIDIKNATSTPIDLTIVAGAGMTLYNATTTPDIPSGAFATLTFKRKSNTDIDVFFNIFQ